MDKAKLPPIAEVEWEDAFSLDEEMDIGHDDAEQVHTRLSVGYLMATKPQVILATTIARKLTTMQGTLTIPRGIVKNIRVLKTDA
jgi:hypothetical protein